MKVLFITHSTDLSGANRSMLQLIRELHQNHHIVPIVVYPHIYVNEKSNIATECERYGIESYSHRITCFKRKKGTITLIHKLYYLLSNMLNVIHLSWMLRNTHIQTVHSNSSVFDTGFWISRLLGVPHIWHLREFGESDFNLVSCIGTRYENWVYSKSEVLIAISKAIRNEFLPKIKDPSRLQLVYNGILPPPAELQAKHSNDVVKFCMVGRVDRYKNQMEALEACHLLKNEGIQNFQLYLIGRIDENYGKELQAYISENNLSDNVFLLGQKFDVPQLLSTMDAGLMLSQNEAFGRVTIEFQMHNLAVIASNTGANVELIDNGRTGLLYNLGNSIALKECMKKLIVDPELLKNISNIGRKAAYSNYTSKHNSSGVAAIYSKLEKRMLNK